MILVSKKVNVAFTEANLIDIKTKVILPNRALSHFFIHIKPWKGLLDMVRRHSRSCGVHLMSFTEKL